MSKNDYIIGFHAVNSYLKQLTKNSISVGTTLYLDKNRRDQRVTELLKLANSKAVSSKTISKAECDKLTKGKHQGVILNLGLATQTSSVKGEAYLDELLEKELPNQLYILLDGVQDPHNLGACLRSADAAGVQAIIIPKDRAVSLTPVVRRVACGADQHVPVICVTNLARTMELLKSYNIWLIGTAGEATTNLYDADLTGNMAIVMGAEEKGLRRLTREKCDILVKIPMHGHVESLNVSVSTGICLFESLRQRRLN